MTIFSAWRCVLFLAAAGLITCISAVLSTLVKGCGTWRPGGIVGSAAGDRTNLNQSIWLCLKIGYPPKIACLWDHGCDTLFSDKCVQCHAKSSIFFRGARQKMMIIQWPFPMPKPFFSRGPKNDDNSNGPSPHTHGRA